MPMGRPAIDPQPHGTHQAGASANACLAAAMVRRTSSSVCAALRNAASNCEGGRYTPLSSMERKKRPKASVSDLDAEVQSVTGAGVKNQVNIEPTRL